MNSNIYLTGFSGTGKSTSGQILATLLKLNFVDMDSKIERQEGRIISEIFSLIGEHGFRRLETKLLESIALEKMQVISTGGGLPTLLKNRMIMARTGKIVYLTATAETIYERLLEQSSQLRENAVRPMLVSDNPMQRIRELLVEREDDYYGASDLIVDTESCTPEQVSQKIIEGLGHEK